MASSKTAVLGAVVGNGALTIIKGVAFLVSGSGAMLSETMHSFADCANQALLFVGIRRSERPADEIYPYGYGAERYFFALLSAMGIFVLGCGVSIYHGVRALLEPHELSLSWLTFAVLGVSLVVEGAVLLIAWKSVRLQKGARRWSVFFRTASDPTSFAVLLEDAVACLGVLVAAAGILLSHVTGNPTYDALASIVIGALLGFVAIVMGVANRRLLLGPAIPRDILEGALAFLESQPSIKAVHRTRTRVLGAHSFRFSADLEFKPLFAAKAISEWHKEHRPAESDEAGWARHLEGITGIVLEALGDEIDRLEGELFERFPELRVIDLEAE